MLGAALTCLSAFLIFAFMLLQLPYEASLVRAMDLEMQLVEACERGHDVACGLIEADQSFRHDVHVETENMQGTCLYVSNHGVALRTARGDVTDVMRKAAALLER